MKLLARATRAVPRRLLPHYGNVMLDLVRQEPGPGGALLQGLFFGRIAPPRSERATFTTPTLVLGHQRDPVHPFSDAGMLAKEMPNARLLEANSLVELRMQPERLTERDRGVPRRSLGQARARQAHARQPASPQTAAAADRARAAARALRAASSRREQFDFVDVHVPGRRRPCRRRTAGALLIHSVTNVNSFVRVAQARSAGASS